MSAKLNAFLLGVGSILDLFGAGRPKLQDISEIRLGTPEDDAKAIRGDFQRVGDDIRQAMAQYCGQTP